MPTLYHPLHHMTARVGDDAEPVIYSRFFEGAPDPSHVDLAERIEHVSGAHYVVSRQAYAKLNDDGEYVDVAKLDRVGGRPVFSIDGQHSTYSPY
jgi:hypothetical protein